MPFLLKEMETNFKDFEFLLKILDSDKNLIKYEDIFN